MAVNSFVLKTIFVSRESRSLVETREPAAIAAIRIIVTTIIAWLGRVTRNLLQPKGFYASFLNCRAYCLPRIGPC